MHDETPTKTHKVGLDRRILNEFSAKILNEERMEKVFETRKNTRLAQHSSMSFRCECDSKACTETIMMSTEEYQHVHSKTRHFVVVPSHVRLDLEEIIESFSNYALVEKFFPNKAK